MVCVLKYRGKSSSYNPREKLLTHFAGNTHVLKCAHFLNTQVYNIMVSAEGDNLTGGFMARLLLLGVNVTLLV